MSYQSPIEVFQIQMQCKIEDEIYKAVVQVGIDIDKDELLKALQYDRRQYQRGYSDRDSEIILCKDCKHNISTSHNPMCELDVQRSGGSYWFCADGEREEGR